MERFGQNLLGESKTASSRSFSYGKVHSQRTPTGGANKTLQSDAESSPPPTRSARNVEPEWKMDCLSRPWFSAACLSLAHCAQNYLIRQNRCAASSRDKKRITETLQGAPNNISRMEVINLSILSLLLSMSTLSITSQLWDLMSLLTLLFRKITKEYDDGSIAALERISTYGDSIKDIYGPFLFIADLFLFKYLSPELTGQDSRGWRKEDPHGTAHLS
ncbi:unnamed protein product [Nezara viridula]|uniref:Uncharacterized protein n=1 Tax=Nezara viridula TaxID=85310 RepID=A0A9P0HMD3_NEZVI|nr:unnamed protein product [Nezara viridula]